MCGRHGGPVVRRRDAGNAGEDQWTVTMNAIPITLFAITTDGGTTLIAKDGTLIGHFSTSIIHRPENLSSVSDAVARLEWTRWISRELGRANFNAKWKADEGGWRQWVDCRLSSLRIRERYKNVSVESKRTNKSRPSDWDSRIKLFVSSIHTAEKHASYDRWTKWVYNVCKNHEKRHGQANSSST